MNPLNQTGALDRSFRSRYFLRAFAISNSRFRGGAFVANPSSSLCVAVATSSIALLKTVSFT